MKGWKTITATIGWALCEGAKTVLPEYSAPLTAIQNIVFLPLGVFGIGHKIDRANMGPYR